MADHPKHQTNRRGWEAERLVPAQIPWHKKRMIQEHTMRYQFASRFVSNKTVIDLACGTGYGCHILQQAGAVTVTGIDISAEAIDYAKAHYAASNIKYLQSDVTKTNLTPHSADVVTSFETVEHLQNDQQFIREVRRLLKPNGIFIISTPNIEFSTGTNPYHVREYTYTECKALLKDFSSIQSFGQRKVVRSLFNFMKKLPSITAFRPWESVSIYPIKSDTNYCYFVFVCKL